VNITTPSEKQRMSREVMGIFSVDPNWYVSWQQCAKWITENSQSGTTAQRPTKNLYNGRRYIDETLNMQITYINGAWRNGLGASV